MKFLKTAGERRKWFSNMRHFSGTRQMGVALLRFGFIIPLAMMVFAALGIVGILLHSHGVALTAGFASLLVVLAGVKHFGKVALLMVGLAAASAGASTGGGGDLTAPQLNMMARAQVLQNSVEMEQQIFSGQFNVANQNVIPIVPRNVGLIKRFRVIVSGNINNTHATIPAVRTPFGIQNVVSNIQFTDLQNNLRINTTGWHLAQVATTKNQNGYGSSLTASDFKNGAATTESIAGDYGNNFPCIIDLVGLAITSNQNFRMVYEVPLAYSDDDLRGAIYANVVNATMNLQVTINPAATAFVAATPADDTGAILANGTCGYNGNLTVTVYQVYLDQLPVGKNGVVLPLLDLSTIYELKNTNYANNVANQENPIPFANFRDFLSVFIVYNNNGLATGHGNGTDINYWALQSANSTNFWKLDPLSVVERWRKLLPFDFPAGTYYFSFRRKPVSTTQYGNMEIVLNPITAAAGNYALVAYEDFALQNVVTSAGSLK